MSRKRGGGFRCRFFLHGWRHVNQPAKQKLLSLEPDETLQVAIELNNPATALAFQLQTREDYHMVGWAPRYLVKDLFVAICDAPDDIRATVVRVNLSPAPAKQRVLIEVKGRWPAGFEPMSTPEFDLLVDVDQSLRHEFSDRS